LYARIRRDSGGVVLHQNIEGQIADRQNVDS
jgi:hypothetical protein